MAEHPKLFQAGVAGAGPYDLIKMTKGMRDNRQARRLAFEHWKQMVGTSSSRDKKNLMEQSPVNKVEQIEAPLFLYHGLIDPVVPPAQSEALAEALKKHNKNFRYYPLEGIPHSFGDPEQSNALHHHILKFLRAHLQP